MRAAAQLQRIGRPIGTLSAARLRAHRHDANLVAVFLAEQRLRPQGACIVRRHDPGLDRAVLAHIAVHLGLDRRKLLGRDRMIVAEVEPQPVRRVQAAPLRDVIAKGPAQRLVQQVRCRVVRADRRPAVVIDRQLRPLATADGAHRDLGLMDKDAGNLLGVGDACRARVGADQAMIADLPAAFGIEGRLVHHDGDLGPLARLGRVGAVDHQRGDLALGLLGVIAQELGGAVLFGQLEPDGRIRGLSGTRPCGTGHALLLGHRHVEPFGLHRAALFAQRVLCQVQRKSERVVQLERGLARQVGPFGQARQFVVQQAQTPVQRLAEPRLLGPQGLLDHRLRACQLRIGRAHLAHQCGHQLVHDRVLRAQHVRVAHRAAHDPAQHVTAPLVGGHHPVRDQEAGRPQVIRDHPVMHLARPVGIRAGRMGRGLDQRPHQVGVIVVVLALQQRADPLQPHAGVDGLHVQRAHRAVLELLVLHEDQVPDLDEAVAILVRAARRAAGDLVAMIEEDLGAGATGTGRAHLPEIVRRRDADDAVVGQARDLLPDLHSLIVGVIDRDQQAILGDREIAGQQLPGMRDRLVLEIVAEAEIAQHLEERVVPRRIAHIVQVVVLAAGANAFLRAGGAVVVARLDPGEQVLELHHAGIGEHQRGVVARDQRAAVHDPVAVPFEIAKESRADVIQTGHGGPSSQKCLRPSRAADGLSPGRCPVQQPACEKAQGLPRARPS